MTKPKIISVVGARPQFVKVAMISRQFAETPDVAHVVIHTGQHFDANMSELFFREMAIPRPDYNLGINSISHGAMTGQMLEAVEKLLIEEKPQLVLVYGDTNSTLAGALAAAKLGVIVAHVEAGLRSYDMNMPEEINRTLTDRLSNLLFCPTTTAVRNLEKEGFGMLDHEVVLSGDVMYDASLHYRSIAEKKSTIIDDLGLQDFVLCTTHRAGNTDDPTKLRSIIEALNDISNEIDVVLPLHPRTRESLSRADIEVACTIMEPVGFFDMIQLLRHCKLVVTDSGGLQKEAYFYEKPCITLRETTEWVELIDAGCNILAGSSGDAIREAYDKMLTASPDFSKRLYGDGSAARRIVEEVKRTCLAV
jgi:UDP-GlcNAc3NAcA epimerase